MKIVDKIEARDRVEKLTEERRDDLFTQLITGKDATEEVETSRGRFTVKFPKAADILAIGKIAAFRRGYRPPESFDAESEMVNAMASTLDVVVVKGPKWFEGAKEANPNFTFLDAPSREFLAELYGKAHSFREKIERRLGEEKGPDDRGVPAEAGADDAVDGGAFGDLSSEQLDARP